MSPNDSFAELRDRVLSGIRTTFPIKGRARTLHLENVEVEDKLHPDDLETQHEAKVGGKSWAVPVYATMSLKDNDTGKVLDQKRVRVAEIPKMTQRYSYIVDGQEYQVDNQWQLKPGIYARRRENGELEARFNVAGRSAFDIIFDPASKVFNVSYKKATLPLYPLLKSMGVPDASLEKSWGKEILQSNQTVKRTGVVEQFYKTTTGQAAPSLAVAEDHLRKTMSDSKLRPEATQITMGKPFGEVTGEALHLATNKLLAIQGGHPEDDRDSLVFKTLRSTGDFVLDQFRNTKRNLDLKIQRQLNSPKTKGVRDIVKFEIFNEPMRFVFHKSSLANPATQINPLEMISMANQTTIMGPGGIKSERSVTEAAKMINPSHLGFLDPINVPEGSKTGVTLRLPVGVRKEGNEAKIPVYSMKEGKTVYINPIQFVGSKVVLPDQVEWKNNRPVPLSPTVKMVSTNNRIEDGKYHEADYVMRHPSQLFNLTSNLIPFTASNNGLRAGYASRHMEQAISLMHREEPLVQVSTPSSEGDINTFEKLVGKQISHFSPVDGTVKSVKPGAITITDKTGKDHRLQIYNNYPLNDAKSMMDSAPVSGIAPGVKVKAGQVLADTNYSRNGTLALGTNLRVGYVPYKGYNFEDGVVISEDAAKKLSSVHLHKPFIQKNDKLIFDPAQFKIRHVGVFDQKQFAKLDDKGVVKVGQKVVPGDPLIVAMQPYDIKDRTGLSAMRKSVSGHHSDHSLRWDGDHEGEVVGVHHGEDKITVHVKTLEPMQVGDKITGRHGNKGIVTMVLPNDQMPHTPDKKPLEVLLNPSGVPGRMNVGQVFETVTSKIAKKTGKPYIVNNFDPKIPDYLEKVKSDLKAHGISDTEELHDPTTGQNLGKALVGNQYMLKLVHQVDKKLSVRSGMSLKGLPAAEGHDSLTLQPSSGGHTGGQSVGALGMYAMLAHGAKANIREMQTWKSEVDDPQTSDMKRWDSDHLRIWSAIQNGTPIPPPKPTFAFHRFTEMLKGTGVNVEKEGHQYVLSPLTDKHVLAMSKGELKDPSRTVRTKLDKNGEYQPIAGGLFDEKVTGGHGGTGWSHIKLAEPMPNPVFEAAIKRLTGLKQKQFDAIVEGKAGVSAGGALVEANKGITGGAGIKALLDSINVEQDLVKAKKALASAPATKVDPLMKKVKYLTTLQKYGMKPSEAYILHNLPVLPPQVRPLAVMPDGSIKYEDVNGLYMQFATINDKLKDPELKANLTDKKKQGMREGLYDGVKALMGVGALSKDKKQRGLLEQIAGTQPKTGYFQHTLINRRQDLTMRSTIVPEPALGLDEVGLPKDAALTLFRPFVVRQLVLQGTAKDVFDAQQKLADVHKGGKDPMVWKALDQVMRDRPVLLKRDPVLHKYGIQAFQPKAVSGNAIQIHPLVTGGYGADFDGDTMAVFVPVSQEAVHEARKMFPSKNLFSETSGKIMYQPTLEGALGLYKLSLTGKDTAHKFDTQQHAIEALKQGKVHYTDIVHVGGQKTTPGRVLIASVLPEPMRKKVLTDFDYKINKSGLSEMLTTVGKDYKLDYGKIVDRVKDLGYGASYGVIKTDFVKDKWVPIGTHSLSLADMKTDKAIRDPVIAAARKEVDAIHASAHIPENDKDRRVIDIWTKASEKIEKAHDESISRAPNNLYLMSKAGVKPDWNQYKQIALAPMIMVDSRGSLIPTPVTKSYSEGLDVAGYWTHTHGARRGAVRKVQEVQEPGYMSKMLMNSAMNLVIDRKDCGTSKGISLPISEKDIHDRRLAQDFKSGGLHLPQGTSLTPDIVSQIRSVDKNAKVVVRSPLKCESDKGICQHCIGPGVTGQDHELGTNIGILSANAVGERAVQLTLKEFHTGGVRLSGGAKMNPFARLEQITNLPEKIPNASTLAMTSGRIDKIEKDPTGTKVWINGIPHHVGKDEHGMPLHEPLPGANASPRYKPWNPPQVGTHVEAGALLSDPNRTIINPHHLYKATKNMDLVQNHLASEMYDLYKDEGVRRRTIETVIKSMSNLTKVQDPGDHPHVMRGEFYPTSVIKRMNEEELKGKKPIVHSPVLMGVDMLPLSLHDDWMARLNHQRLRTTIADAAMTAMKSDIHGTHPIPGIAYGAEFGLPHLARTKDGKPANLPAYHY